MLSGVSFLVVVRGLLVVVASLVAEHRRWGVHAPVLAARRLAQYCGVQASAAVAMGSVALRHVESSQTRRGTLVPCIGRHILNRQGSPRVVRFLHYTCISQGPPEKQNQQNQEKYMYDLFILRNYFMWL